MLQLWTYLHVENFLIAFCPLEFNEIEDWKANGTPFLPSLRRLKYTDLQTGELQSHEPFQRQFPLKIR